MKLKAVIEATHIQPQEFNHLRYVLERELSRNGVIVKIYGTDNT